MVSMAISTGDFPCWYTGGLFPGRPLPGGLDMATEMARLART